MRAMVTRALRQLGLPTALSGQLRIEYDSTIPVAKGMASSTADIAATAQATARHFGHEFDEPTLAALCVALEPTDSTLFSTLTLFDHQHAGVHIPCGGLPCVDVLVLESPATLRTADFHQRDRRRHLLAQADTLDTAWRQLKQACETGSAARLGEATTLSALASQLILPKPGLNALLNIVEGMGLYGVNVAHSGSVVGLLLDRHQHDVEKVSQAVSASDTEGVWPRHHLLKVTSGGVV